MCQKDCKDTEFCFVFAMKAGRWHSRWSYQALFTFIPDIRRWIRLTVFFKWMETSKNIHQQYFIASSCPISTPKIVGKNCGHASEHKDLVFFILSPTGVWCLIQTTQLFQLIWRGSCQVFIIAIRGTFAWRHPTRMERMAIQQPRHQPLDFDLRVIVRRWKFWSGTRAMKAT